MNRIFPNSVESKPLEEEIENMEADAFLAEIEEIDINLKSSCVACPFVACCNATDERGSPDRDVLVGTYRFLSLKEKCII